MTQSAPSNTAGKSTSAPGKLQPFLLPSKPPFSISHSTELEPRHNNGYIKVYLDNWNVSNLYKITLQFQ
ncbi:UNVERIFIED_CONTAM: hypothetical protein NCL1_36764 [Trichonephila clavipes]